MITEKFVESISEIRPEVIISLAGTLDLEFDSNINQMYDSQWEQNTHSIIYNLKDDFPNNSQALLVCNVSPSCQTNIVFDEAIDIYLASLSNHNFLEYFTDKKDTQIGFGSFTSNGINYLRYRIYKK